MESELDTFVTSQRCSVLSYPAATLVFQLGVYVTCKMKITLEGKYNRGNA